MTIREYVCVCVRERESVCVYVCVCVNLRLDAVDGKGHDYQKSHKPLRPA